MSSSQGILLTNWTIRLALVCYVAYLTSELAIPGWRWRSQRCVVWTLGCVLFDVHVACAFHFFHRWSHASAWQHTNERTLALLGFAFGSGIYFSYAFLVLWWLDVAWLSRTTAPTASLLVETAAAGDATTIDAKLASAVPAVRKGLVQWPPWRQALHLFLFFIAFNGAVIFESGPTRWAGLATCLGIAAFALLGHVGR